VAAGTITATVNSKIYSAGIQARRIGTGNSLPESISVIHIIVNFKQWPSSQPMPVDFLGLFGVGSLPPLLAR
jgi:hypothetical protein